MGAQWKVVLFYVVLAVVVVVSAAMQPSRGRSRDSILGELLRESLQKTAAARLSRHAASSPQQSAPSSTGQLNDLENIFQRIRKQAPPAVRCGGGGGGNPYECNDGLMGVWLRLMKNPDYSD